MSKPNLPAQCVGCVVGREEFEQAFFMLDNYHSHAVI